MRKFLRARDHPRSDRFNHFGYFYHTRIPSEKSVLCEVYPALWSGSFQRADRDDHQHDAYSIAAWLRRADSEGLLSDFFHPQLEQEERRTAEIEGWVLGVV